MSGAVTFKLIMIMALGGNLPDTTKIMATNLSQQACVALGDQAKTAIMDAGYFTEENSPGISQFIDPKKVKITYQCIPFKGPEEPIKKGGKPKKQTDKVIKEATFNV